MWVRVHILGVAACSLLCERLLLFGPRAVTSGMCPEIEGSPDPDDPSHVDALFWDVYGCQVPLRHGIGHLPWQPTDFGYQHIASRRAEGRRNHELTSFAMRMWADAMVNAGAMEDHDFVCYQTQHTIRGGVKRTMRVFVDYKPSMATSTRASSLRTGSTDTAIGTNETCRPIRALKIL